MSLLRIFIASTIFLAFFSVCFGEAERGVGEIELRIYQEYDMQHDIYVFQEEIVGADEWFAQKGSSKGAIYEHDVGEIVQYNFYFEEEYAGSCEIPYGEGECSIIANPPEGFSLEGKRFWIESGSGINDVNIAVVPESTTSVELPPVSSEYEISISEMMIVGYYCFDESYTKDEIWVAWHMHNLGDDITTSFDVDVLMDGKQVETLRFEYFRGETLIQPKTRKWKINEPGNHTVTIILDPENVLQESNREDNVASLSFSASEGAQPWSNENENVLHLHIVLWDVCNYEESTIPPELAKYEVIDGFEELPDQNIELQSCEGVICKDYCDGDTLYSGSCNLETGECEYSSKVCPDGCDAESARCIEVFGNIRFSVLIDEGYDGKTIASGGDAITVKASLIESMENLVEPIEGAEVKIELSAPESEYVFWKTEGNLVAEGKTDEYGEFEATFEVPHWEEFYLGRQGGSTNLEVTVDASKHDSEYDFDYSDGPYPIEVISPAIVIRSVSISPDPAQAYQEHTISIEVSDDYAKGPTHYSVKVPEGILSYNDFGGKLTGGYGGGIGFDSWSSPVVHWNAPERGLTQYEFDYAKEANEVLGEYGAQSGMTLVKTAGYFVPVIDAGKDMYGMYGDTMDIWEEKDEFGSSLSVKEKVYRGADIGLSGVKFGVGAVDLVVGNVPVLGKLSDFTADTVNAGIDTGEIYLKEAAAEERLAHMETRSMDMYVEVDVVDADGYTDTDYFIFEMEYLWEKEG